jgi:hypothetical protein
MVPRRPTSLPALIILLHPERAISPQPNLVPVPSTSIPARDSLGVKDSAACIFQPSVRPLTNPFFDN